MTRFRHTVPRDVLTAPASAPAALLQQGGLGLRALAQPHSHGHQHHQAAGGGQCLHAPGEVCRVNFVDEVLMLLLQVHPDNTSAGGPAVPVPDDCVVLVTHLPVQQDQDGGSGRSWWTRPSRRPASSSSAAPDTGDDESLMAVLTMARRSLDGVHCSPVCELGCEEGECTAPNTCTCREHYGGPTCNTCMYMYLGSQGPDLLPAQPVPRAGGAPDASRPAAVTMARVTLCPGPAPAPRAGGAPPVTCPVLKTPMASAVEKPAGTCHQFRSWLSSV